MYISPTQEKGAAATAAAMVAEMSPEMVQQLLHHFQKADTTPKKASKRAASEKADEEQLEREDLDVTSLATQDPTKKRASEDAADATLEHEEVDVMAIATQVAAGESQEVDPEKMRLIIEAQNRLLKQASERKESEVGAGSSGSAYAPPAAATGTGGLPARPPARVAARNETVEMVSAAGDILRGVGYVPGGRSPPRKPPRYDESGHEKPEFPLALATSTSHRKEWNSLMRLCTQPSGVRGKVKASPELIQKWNQGGQTRVDLFRQWLQLDMDTNAVNTRLSKVQDRCVNRTS